MKIIYYREFALLSLGERGRRYYKAESGFHVPSLPGRLAGSSRAVRRIHERGKASGKEKGASLPLSK